MKYHIFIAAFILFASQSCSQNNSDQKKKATVTALYNRIVPLVEDLDNPDSCRQAILYLDSTTAIDRNCFLCYRSKIMFLNSLNQFDKAIETVNECIRIRPFAYDLYLEGGMLYDKARDTINAKTYYQKSLTILDPVLDTIDKKNPGFKSLAGDKTVILILLGETRAANNFLDSVSDQLDPRLKDLILLGKNKSRKELVDLFFTNNYSE